MIVFAPQEEEKKLQKLVRLSLLVQSEVSCRSSEQSTSKTLLLPVRGNNLSNLKIVIILKINEDSQPLVSVVLSYAGRLVSDADHANSERNLKSSEAWPQYLLSPTTFRVRALVMATIDLGGVAYNV